MEAIVSSDDRRHVNASARGRERALLKDAWSSHLGLVTASGSEPFVGRGKRVSEI